MSFESADAIHYCHLMAESFQRFTGQPLASGADMATAMWMAPQPIVSHGIEADPVFRYANRCALELWDMDWESFVRLPSRCSAEPLSEVQSDRDALLLAALAKGWIDNYSGIRISSSGRRFEIRNTILWNVVDGVGVRHGQAAFIGDWRYV